MIPAFEVASMLARALDAGGIPYAIGGAIALGVWSDPRSTYDVDINLFVEGAELERAFDVLEGAGVVLDRQRALAAAADGDVIVGRLAGMRVDVFAPSIPFSFEAMRTRRRVRGPLGEAAYLSPEASAVFKLLFFRAKDLVDVEKLLVVQGDAIDRAYIRRWLVEMMGDDDDRITAWDAMCARHP